ncbi:hypothetical protein GGX14DRAFT_580294 [Mycena pura]|uniref:Uncharacterized protein n=1 Tax=Mycena pura TaxID=153505 RepID=A0AAD6UTC6_9AGAR|nr:hypothetical protein GGX14DRAFT_580294 [Mycena pura]
MPNASSLQTPAYADTSVGLSPPSESQSPASTVAIHESLPVCFSSASLSFCPRLLKAYSQSHLLIATILGIAGVRRPFFPLPFSLMTTRITCPVRDTKITAQLFALENKLDECITKKAEWTAPPAFEARSKVKNAIVAGVKSSKALNIVDLTVIRQQGHGRHTRRLQRRAKLTGDHWENLDARLVSIRKHATGDAAHIVCAFNYFLKEDRTTRSTAADVYEVNKANQGATSQRRSKIDPLHHVLQAARPRQSIDVKLHEYWNAIKGYHKYLLSGSMLPTIPLFPSHAPESETNIGTSGKSEKTAKRKVWDPFYYRI